MHLKEGKPRTIRELGEIADNYVEAHATDIVFGIDPRQHRIRSLQSDTRRCHNCGTGHLKNQCPKRVSAPKPPSPPRPQRVPQPSNQRQWQTQQQKPAPRCFVCNKSGHIARNCFTKTTAAAEFYTQDEESDEAQEQAAAFQPLRTAPPNRYNSPAPPCRIHNMVNCTVCNKCRMHDKFDCPECMKLPGSVHHCQACRKNTQLLPTHASLGTTVTRCPLQEVPSKVNPLMSSGIPAVRLSWFDAPSFQMTNSPDEKNSVSLSTERSAAPQWLIKIKKKQKKRKRKKTERKSARWREVVEAK